MENEAPAGGKLNETRGRAEAAASLYKVNAMKGNKTKRLRLVLILLVVALAAVVGYVLWQEYQYGVSEKYYDSLRNTGLLKGGWLL